MPDELGFNQYGFLTPLDLIQAVRLPPAPRFVLIPAFRQIRPNDDGRQRSPESSIEDGLGLLQKLAQWQHPAITARGTHQQEQRWFDQIVEFLRDVLEEPRARLVITNAATQGQVALSQYGDLLPLEALGDGIKQVLMIAASCTAYEHALIAIEEPETHLHPTLQRKLLRYLADHTKNQYLIATHSAHILDTPGAHVFHVIHDGTSTTVSPPVRQHDLANVAEDLGYRASDLLQTNYTIWVEGPSDRIYWKRWLELVAPDLIEGTHYSLMPYGGRLIDGVTVRTEDDPQIQEDLIKILQLGRRCTVIADSDKNSPQAELHPQIQRLIDEAHGHDYADVLVCGWARTVENLIPASKFRTLLLQKHTRSTTLVPRSDDPFRQPFGKMKASSYSKTSIARHIAPQILKADIGVDLRHALDELADRIRRANGVSPAIVIDSNTP